MVSLIPGILLFPQQSDRPLVPSISIRIILYVLYVYYTYYTYYIIQLYSYYIINQLIEGQAAGLTLKSAIFVGKHL